MYIEKKIPNLIALLFIILLLLGCEPDFTIIKRNGFAKNKERLQNNIPIIPREFNITLERFGNNTYLFCKTANNEALNHREGKEVFLDTNNQIDYERDAYTHQDSVIQISSYYGKLKHKSYGYIIVNEKAGHKIPQSTALQIVQRWQRQ